MARTATLFSLSTAVPSERHDDAVERRVAVHEVDALGGDPDSAVHLYQVMECGPRAQPLALAAIFDHHELRAHGAGVDVAVLDQDIGNDAGGAGARLLRIDPRA